MILNTFKAAAVALALAGGSLAAVAPAQAASPTFGFNLNFGAPSGGIVLQFGDNDYWDYCLSNKQIVYGLNAAGYSNVKIVKESSSSNKVWAVGRKGSKWYQMRVDSCSHRVDQVKRIYPLDRGGNSFNLTFTF